MIKHREALDPQQDSHLAELPSASPITLSRSSTLPSSALLSVPFSDIQNSETKSESDLMQSKSDDVPPGRVSKHDLIARGRVLLDAYQSQKNNWLVQRTQANEKARPPSPASTRNIFQPSLTKEKDAFESTYSSPTNRPVTRLSIENGPFIDTKLDNVSPHWPRPSSLESMKEQTNSNPGHSKVTINQTPLSEKRSEKSWNEFMQLLQTMGQVMDQIDVVVAENLDKSKAESKKTTFVSQLMTQKREIDMALVKLVEVLGCRVFLMGKLQDDAVQFVCHQVKLELEAAQMLVEKAQNETKQWKEKDKTVNSDFSVENECREQVQDTKEHLERQEEHQHTVKASTPPLSASEANFDLKPVDSEPWTTRQDASVDSFDVVFTQRGPIGIDFQANVPDAGASVRSLVPDTAAAKTNLVKPKDELVAVNHHAVETAPFRHVMLLLQGGLRPLTLTFKRKVDPIQRQMSLFGDRVALEEEGRHDDWTDKELKSDEGMVIDLEQLRVPKTLDEEAGGRQNDDGNGDLNVADVIISNLFSLFWKPPEINKADVQTV